jgi:hypothetical protein
VLHTWAHSVSSQLSSHPTLAAPVKAVTTEAAAFSAALQLGYDRVVGAVGPVVQRAVTAARQAVAPTPPPPLRAFVIDGAGDTGRARPGALYSSR